MPPPMARPMHLSLLLLLWWCVLLSSPEPAACSSPPQPGGVNTTTLISTAWGGGVSGNTPGNIGGAVGVASLSSAGATAWMGSSCFDANTSTFYLVDSGHPTSVSAYSAYSAGGLVSFTSVPPATGCVASQQVKAVQADGAGGLWSVDSGCGAVQYRDAAGVFTTALSVAPSPTKPASLAIRRDATFVYAGLGTAIIRIASGLVACVKAGLGGCGVYNTTLVHTTAASNVTLSFDQQTAYYIDSASISSVSLTLSTASYPTTATQLVLTGASRSIVYPTALALSPTGQALIVADYLSGGINGNYTVIRSVNLSTLAVSTLGPNNVQSNCAAGSNSDQNGAIGGPACFGLIQQLVTGTGTLGGQLLFFEVNTGRIRALDWSTLLMRTVIGGGPVNNGYSDPSNTPLGWAKGYGAESSVDSALVGLQWDATHNVGYVAQTVRQAAGRAQHTGTGQLTHTDAPHMQHTWPACVRACSAASLCFRSSVRSPASRCLLSAAVCRAMASSAPSAAAPASRTAYWATGSRAWTRTAGRARTVWA